MLVEGRGLCGRLEVGILGVATRGNQGYGEVVEDLLADKGEEARSMCCGGGRPGSGQLRDRHYKGGGLVSTGSRLGDYRRLGQRKAR